MPTPENEAAHLKTTVAKQTTLVFQILKHLVGRDAEQDVAAVGPTSQLRRQIGASTPCLRVAAQQVEGIGKAGSSIFGDFAPEQFGAGGEDVRQIVFRRRAGGDLLGEPLRLRLGNAVAGHGGNLRPRPAVGKAGSVGFDPVGSAVSRLSYSQGSGICLRHGRRPRLDSA